MPEKNNIVDDKNNHSHLSPLQPSLDGEPLTRENNDRASSFLNTFDKSEAFSKQKTRSSATEAEYQRKYKQIVDESDLSEEAILTWFESAAHYYTPATLRAYKSAAIWALSRGGDVYLDTIERIRAIESGRKTKSAAHPKKTSSRKRRTLKPQDCSLLLKDLANQDTPLATATSLFCQASLICGVRPSEWASATISGNLLTVANGKNSNGRATGPTRSLALAEDDASADRQRAILSSFIDLVPKTGPEQVSAFLRSIYMCLRRTSINLFGQNRAVCLYTLRHQYAANMKKRHGKATVAVAMGHRSDRTAGTHYARAVHAWDDSIFDLAEYVYEQPITDASVAATSGKAIKPAS